MCCLLPTVWKRGLTMFRKPNITTEQSDGNSSIFSLDFITTLNHKTCKRTCKLPSVRWSSEYRSNSRTPGKRKKGSGRGRYTKEPSNVLFQSLRKVDEKSSVVASDGTSYSRISSLTRLKLFDVGILCSCNTAHKKLPKSWTSLTYLHKDRLTAGSPMNMLHCRKIQGRTDFKIWKAIRSKLLVLS